MHYCVIVIHIIEVQNNITHLSVVWHVIGIEVTINYVMSIVGYEVATQNV